AIDEAFDIRIIHVGYDIFDHDVAVDLTNSFLSCGSLRHSLFGVLFLKKRLSLKVCVFDKIAIDDPHLSDAGPRKHFGMRGAERSTPDDQNSRIQELFLAL